MSIIKRCIFERELFFLLATCSKIVISYVFFLSFLYPNQLIYKEFQTPHFLLILKMNSKNSVNENWMYHTYHKFGR